MWSRDASVALACSALALVLAAVLAWVFVLAVRFSKQKQPPQQSSAPPLPVPRALPLREADALGVLAPLTGSPPRPAVVMVYKPLCSACVKAKPEFEAAAGVAAAAGVQFFLVDGEQAPALRAAHGVRRYPAFLGIGADGAVRRPAPHLPLVQSTFLDFAASLASSPRT